MSDNIKILKNYLLYFSTLLLICIIGISNVFAETTTQTFTTFNTTAESLSSSIQCNNNICVVYGVTQYDYQMNFEWGSVSDKTCQNASTVTGKLSLSKTSMGINNNDFLWTNVYIVNNNNASNCNWQVGTNDTTFTCTVDNLKPNFKIGYSLNSMGGQYTYDSVIYRSMDITCDTSTAQIIENNNANTQNVINNNNTNTQNIINNQNQNTQDIIDSNKVCKRISPSLVSTLNAYISFTGDVTNTILKPDNRYKVFVYEFDELNQNYSFIFNGYNRLRVGSSNTLYNDNNLNNKSITYMVYDGEPVINNTYTITPTEKYVYFYLSSSTEDSGSITFQEKEVCKDGNQAIDDSINNLDDSINNLDDTINDDDTTGAESEASEFFSSFDTETFGLTSIITSPLNLIRSVLSSTCTELQLPLPYLDNKKLTLPCMSSIYSQFFGSFFTIYQTITYGIIAYWVCVRIFNQVKDFKNPEHDEIEVMDL